MKLDNIKKIILSGESHTVEFKKSTAQIKRACETLCAFLNGDGGMVIIGVDDSGKIFGQEVSEKTKREIGQEIIKINPHPKLEKLYIKLPNSDKYLIILHAITDSVNKPYHYDNKAYVRNETNTIPMTHEYVKQLTLNNAGGNYSWKSQILDNITINDLDTDEILTTIHKGCLHGRIPEDYATDDPILALKRLDLIIDDKITNAALVLFGHKPELLYPQCILKLARFRGIDKNTFIDNKQVTGNIFKLLKYSVNFLNNYLPIESTFPDNQIERVDTPLFPIKVLREAVANALCHRDYSNYSGSINISVYDDRVEIWNYGLFPLGVTVENLKDLNRSIPRNRKIANVLYYHKIFESWGRGVKMIIDECIKMGHPTPVYSQDPVGTLLTLIPKNQIGGSAQAQVLKSDPRFEKLTEQQIAIIVCLQKKGKLSPKEIANMTPEIHERTLRRDLNKLKDLGYVNYIGETTSRRWYSLV